MCNFRHGTNLNPGFRNILTKQYKIWAVEGGFQILLMVLQNKNKILHK